MNTSDKPRSYTLRFRPQLFKRLKVAAFEADRPFNKFVNETLESACPALDEPVRKAGKAKPARETASVNSTA